MLPTIRRGAEGDAVKVAQILTEFGDLSGAFDKLFGTYVKSWQLNHGLDADGIIGPKTWTALSKVAPTVSIRSLRSGKYALAVQLALGITQSSVFDEATKAAVVAYQSAAGLKADGIVGPKTWAALICGTTSSDERAPEGKVLNPCIHYLQWDKRWKNIMYSNHGDKKQTIGNSGCGPTSMAMIMATMIDETVTPVEMCNLALHGGFRTKNSGTDWGFFKYVANRNEGFSKFVKTGSLNTALAAIRAGALVVCSMNSGDNAFWTKGGHFITAIGCDETYVYANDPNKSAHPRKQKIEKFKKCMKQAFIFEVES